jgi:hypothetical protein
MRFINNLVHHLMTYTLCAFLLTKSLNLLLYSFFPICILGVVIYSLAKDGSQGAFGHCEGLDPDQF